MPELIQNRVRKGTELAEGYKVYASSQSMIAYAHDWRKAVRRLERQIAVLQDLIDERKEQEDNGTWPDVVALYEKNLEAANHVEAPDHR